MRLLALAGLTLALVVCGCVTVQRKVEVTPGTVPPEVRGARWPEPPVSYCVVRDEAGYVEHDTLVAVAQEAIARWGVPVQYEGDCPGRGAPGHGRNEVGWADLSSSPTSLDEAGNTNIRYQTSNLGGTARITEADILLEVAPPEGKDTPECLFTTLLHEAGHLFGLHHLEEGTVMSPVITDCIQELTPADRAALAAIY